MANYSLRADSLLCFQTAKMFSLGNYSALLQGNYVYFYPYQLGLIFFEEILFRLFGNNSILLFQLINCISMIITYYLIVKIFDILFKKENNSILLMILLFCFIFYIFFCSFVYGNLISFCLSVISIYYFLLFNNESKKWKKILFALVSVISMGIAYCIKSTALIIVIALVIISFISFFDKKDKIHFIYILLMILFFSLPLNIIYKYYENRSNITINSGVPKIGWIAMGLHDGMIGPGWWDDSARQNYINVGYDDAHYNELVINDIKDHLNNFKNHPKSFILFFYKKISSQWNNPTYQALWNLTDTGKNKIANSLIKGRLYNYSYVYGNYYQLIIYFGCLLYLIMYRKDSDYLKMLFLLIFIGGFLFYCMWEAKSQYILQFFVGLIPYACLGYNKSWLICSKLYKKYKINKTKSR